MMDQETAGSLIFFREDFDRALKAQPLSSGEIRIDASRTQS